MASSVRKAQIPVCCQLCDSPSAIKWKCKECAFLMCDTCKNVHRRIKTSEEHSIVSIQDIQIEGKDSINGSVISSVIQTYTTNLGMVNSIILTEDESIYLLYNPAGNRDGYIVEARLLRNSIKILKKIDIPCMEIVKTNNNEIVFSEYGTCKIKLLSRDGSVKPFLDVSPMLPLAKNFNQHGEFLLGLREQGPALPSTQFSTRKLAIFGKDNKIKLTVEFDNTGTKLFSYIWRITTDSKDNIYAIDHINNDSDGRIVALSRSGNVNFIYAGHSSINSTDNPFRPKDIIVTQNGSILVTDSYNHTLHQINEKGETIAFQNTKKHGIELPYSLCFDSEGFLLIGCNTYEKDKDEANIYVVKITV